MVATHERAPGVFEVELARNGLSYQPGDCTLLVRDDGVDSRPYSFSSHPDEPVLRFLIREMTGRGGLSSWLADLQPGDSVGVGTPFGWFRPGQTEREVWIATGTGISPFLSALRANRPLRPLGLWFGLRDVTDAILRPWLEERVDVRWSFSRAASGSKRSHVTDAVDEIPVEDDVEYYLCGNQRMCIGMKAALQERGVSPGRIHEELFCP